MNIAIGALMHESNTFSPLLTDLQHFRRTEYATGNAMIDAHRHKKSEIGGMLSLFAERGVTVLPTLSAWAMPSGRVRRDTYLHLKEKLLDGLRCVGGEVGGVLLTLHGAMTVEGLEDPEGDILSTVRKLLPPDTFLAATLDHHALVTALMVENADFLIGYRTHPHVDQFDVGRAAAGHLLKLIDERPRIAKSFIKLPLITPTENRSEPIDALHDEVRRIETDFRVITASYFVGYAWADLSIQGASALVVTYGDERLARDYARSLANRMWELRKDFQFPIYSVKEAVRIGLQSPRQPFVLDELCDCTLGGASGDVVTTARYLIENRIENSIVVGIVDPEAVAAMSKLGVGSGIRCDIGGKVCTLDNPPLAFEGIVKKTSENVAGSSSIHAGYETRVGKTIVVESCGVELILIERAGKIDGPSFLESLGINPRRKKFIIVKEGLNPLVTYKVIAAQVLMVDSPGFDAQILSAADYPNVPRPIYPLDKEMSWSA